MVKKRRRVDAQKENDSLTDIIKTAVSVFTEKLGWPSRSSGSPKAACGISASKLSSEYLSQLSSLQELLEKGVLSEEEFQEQKRFALSNLRGLNKDN